MEVHPDLKKILQDHSDSDGDIFWGCGAVEVPRQRTAEATEPESSRKHGGRDQNLDTAICHRHSPRFLLEHRREARPLAALGSMGERVYALWQAKTMLCDSLLGRRAPRIASV